jgi:hypothetical protein
MGNREKRGFIGFEKEGKEWQTSVEAKKKWQVEERGEEEEKRGKRVADNCRGEQGIAG